ncbi:glycosyltransferase, partial [Micromonospora chalcea]
YSGDAIVLSRNRLSATELDGLYDMADAFVLPSRGEGWGRPYTEAMARGVLTIGTNWGGQLDYMDSSNSLLIDATVVPVSTAAAKEWPNFGGHQWAEPSVDHLRALMRRAYSGEIDRASLAANAQRSVARYRIDAVGNAVRRAVAGLVETR